MIYLYIRECICEFHLTPFFSRTLTRTYTYTLLSLFLSFFLSLVKAAVILMHGESKQDAQGRFQLMGPREVPFIAQYRREAVGFPHILNLHGL